MNRAIVRASELPPPRFKTRVRNAWLAVSSPWRSGSKGVAERLATPRVQFLCLHHVFVDEEEPLQAMLRELSREHELAAYSEAVGLIGEGNVPRARIAVTFDDGFKNHLTAARILEEFGTRGMFFVCTEALDAAGDAGAAAEVCRRCFGRPSIELMGWKDAEWLVSRGHEVGCHTRSHPSLAACGEERAREEIWGAACAMRGRLGPVAHFAWPYGRWVQMNERLVGIIGESGFATAASAEMGSHAGGQRANGLRARSVATAPGAPMCIRRVSVHAHWPLAWVRCTLADAVRDGTVPGSGWPEGWNVTGEAGAAQA